MQETIFRQAKYDASLSVYSSLYKAKQLPVGNLRPIGVSGDQGFAIDFSRGPQTSRYLKFSAALLDK